MLVNGITRKVELEHEPGSWVVVRALSWSELDEARGKRNDLVIAKARDLGPALLDSITSIRRRVMEPPHVLDTEATPSDESTPDAGIIQEVRAKLRDPLNDYDIGTVLKYGIMSWSYGQPVNEKNIALLDEETAEVVARAIIPSTDRGKG